MLGGVWFAVLFPKAYNAALGRPGRRQPRRHRHQRGADGPLGITAFGDALVFGLIVGVGYLTTNTVMIAINPNVPRPLLVSTVLVAV